MSFLEHLEELRVRLIRALLSLVVGFMICWGFAHKIFYWMTEPLRKGYPGAEFIATEPTEKFMIYMKVAFFAGIFVAAPYILYEIWAFISPGLYKHEKAYAVPFIASGSIFFLGGALFGHYILFPLTFNFLANIGDPSIKYMAKINEYFSFYSWFLLALGIVFQLPIVIFVLSRIGIVTAGFLMRQFKYAVLAAFIISAVITPSGDMFTQTALALPMLGLYLLGVLVSWIFGRPRRREEPPTSAEG